MNLFNETLMKLFSSPRRCAATTALLVMFGATSPASALEPADSTYIDMVTISSLYGTISADDDTTLLVGIDGCERALDVNGNIGVNFTFPANSSIDPTTDPMIAGDIGYKGVYFFSRGIDQGSSPACLTSDCTQVDSSDVTRSMTAVDVQVPFRTLTGLAGASDCAISGQETDYFIRLQLGDVNNASPFQADARVRMDLVRPEPPVSFDAVVTEDAIELTWEDGPSADVENYRIIYSSTQFDGEDFSENIEGSQRATVIASSANRATTSLTRELTPNEVVWVAVASVDRVGNESILTTSQPFTVIDTVGFWEAYKAGGGEETGGFCSAAPHSSPANSPLPLLGLFGLLILGARRARQQHSHGA